MSLAVALLIIAAVTAVSVVLMLVVRRHAPPGGRFGNHDHPAAVFCVIGTVFAILLGFIILFAFDSHSTARTAASTEASTVLDAYEDAALFDGQADVLQGELICYARAVIYDGWDQLDAGRPSDLVEAWTSRLNASTNALDVRGQKQSIAFDDLLDARNQRDEARRVRLQEAGHTIPAIIWVAVILACLVPLGFVLLFADPNESRITQGAMAASVAALTVAAFLAVWSLDDPFSGGEGSIPPASMRLTLEHVEDVHRAEGRPMPPCTARGVPLGS